MPTNSPSKNSSDKPPGDSKPILMIAVVQAQDADSSFETLKNLGVSCDRLASVGGFLGRKNVTLLIGLPVEKQNTVMAALQENCRQRVEYIAVPLESAPLPLPTPTPITVGGATIFSLDIDHFEEF
ncbi:MAG: cyclic-di-AMP receptor [Anaerolineaceae bacterium]